MVPSLYLNQIFNLKQFRPYGAVKEILHDALIHHLLHILRKGQGKRCALAFFGTRLDFAVVALNDPMEPLRLLQRAKQLRI